MYDVLYSPYKEKAEMVQKILGKSDIYKKKATSPYIMGSELELRLCQNFTNLAEFQ